MANRNHMSGEQEDEDIAAARWILAIDAGLPPERMEAFNAWLAERPERSELIARQAMLQDIAKQAARQSFAERSAQLVATRHPPERAQKSRRGFLFAGLLATGAIAFGAVALTVNTPLPASIETYETATGEVRLVELSDTTRLWLDTRTKLSASMATDRRDMTLTSGRLFVEVARNPRRPFIVHGAGFEARAVGTAFEATVFADRNGVAVTEGVVRLTPTNGGPSIDLVAGESAWITRSGEVMRSDARSIGAWREHRMTISDRRLDVVLTELSRYFDRPLTVADAQLAARRVTLSFSIADLGAEDAAHIIARAVGADVANQANAGILLKPATIPR